MFSLINPGFRPSPTNITDFRRDGFLRLESFLTLELIAHIRGRITDQMIEQGEEQRGFSRLGYDIFGSDAVIMELVQDPAFGGLLTELTEHPLFFTQGVGFELEKNKHHGFPWHIGTQSFGYQRAKDYGCSIWIPLDPIDDSGQGGGMSYVPEHLLSGQFMYDQVDPAIDLTLHTMAADGDLTFQDFIELRHGILNSPAMALLLGQLCRSDDFAPGDALFFNKRVIHRSNPLEEGPLASRRAFVMRFVELGSRYDARRAQGLEIPRIHFGIAPQSNFHLDVCQHDGDLIAESPLFPFPERRQILQRSGTR